MAAGAATAALPRWARAHGTGALLLRDVSVIDGSGAPAFAADVLVEDGRIARVGRIERGDAPGARVIEGGGRVLAAGCMYLHGHGNPLSAYFQAYLTH